MVRSTPLVPNSCLLPSTMFSLLPLLRRKKAHARTEPLHKRSCLTGERETERRQTNDNTQSPACHHSALGSRGGIASIFHKKPKSQVLFHSPPLRSLSLVDICWQAVDLCSSDGSIAPNLYLHIWWQLYSQTRMLASGGRTSQRQFTDALLQRYTCRSASSPPLAPGYQILFRSTPTRSISAL